MKDQQIRKARAKAVEEGGESYWRQFLVELLMDALRCGDKEHPGAVVVARAAVRQFPDDPDVTRLTTAILSARAGVH